MLHERYGWLSREGHPPIPTAAASAGSVCFYNEQSAEGPPSARRQHDPKAATSSVRSAHGTKRATSSWSRTPTACHDPRFVHEVPDSPRPGVRPLSEGGRTTVGERRRQWQVVSAALADLGDDEMTALLSGGRVGYGIGGAHSVLDLADIRVFAKSVPLTEEERRSARTTANLFGLPAHCQYGVRSPSFNVWRELAAHERTTGWVLDGDHASFPLLYHSRVLPGSSYEVQPEHADVEAAVTFFGGDRSVALRLEATAAARWSLVLFLEHVPWNVEDWLGRELARGDAAAEAAIEFLQRTLLVAIRSMNDRGLFHFDSHLRNILTDGDAVYVSDFGLVTSLDFDLTATERSFVDDHLLHDPAYMISRVVNHVVTALSGVVDPAAPDYAVRNAYIRRCAEGAEAGGVPAVAAAFITRFAPLVVVMNDFYWQLFEGAPFPPFPREAVAAAAAATRLIE